MAGETIWIMSDGLSCFAIIFRFNLLYHIVPQWYVSPLKHPYPIHLQFSQWTSYDSFFWAILFLSFQQYFFPCLHILHLCFFTCFNPTNSSMHLLNPFTFTLFWHFICTVFHIFQKFYQFLGYHPAAAVYCRWFPDTNDFFSEDYAYFLSAPPLRISHRLHP